MAQVRSGSGPSEGVSTKAGEKNENESQKRPLIEDDEEGHLVYKEGSIITDRCSYLFDVAIEILSNVKNNVVPGLTKCLLRYFDIYLFDYKIKS